MNRRIFNGHLHINLNAGTRQGAGRALIERFCAAGMSRGLKGIRIGVREDNASGRAFFEKLGFQFLNRRFGFRAPGSPPRDYFVIEYGKNLLNRYA